MALMKQAVIPEFFARLKKAIPEPETELEYDNVYQLLVSVVLSAQATSSRSSRLPPRWWRSARKS
jgi:endonuclease-3